MREKVAETLVATGLWAGFRGMIWPMNSAVLAEENATKFSGNGLIALHEGAYLRQGLKSCGLYRHEQISMIPTSPPPAHLTLETQPSRQAHVSLDKAAT